MAQNNPADSDEPRTLVLLGSPPRLMAAADFASLAPMENHLAMIEPLQFAAAVGVVLLFLLMYVYYIPWHDNGAMKLLREAGGDLRKPPGDALEQWTAFDASVERFHFEKTLVIRLYCDGVSLQPSGAKEEAFLPYRFVVRQESLGYRFAFVGPSGRVRFSVGRDLPLPPMGADKSDAKAMGSKL
jgi:hypothetical protein